MDHRYIKVCFNVCIGLHSIPVTQIIEHGASNTKVMGLIPRE